MAYLRAFGSSLPGRIVTNEELAPQLGIEPSWIFSQTGIRERRYASVDDTVASLGLSAAQQALEKASLTPDDLGMILVASGSSDRFCPGPASTIAALLGLCLLVPATGARAARAPSSAPGVHHYVPPVRGGTLVDGLLEQPDHLLPNFSRRFSALLVQQVLFAPLFYSDDHGVIQPGLCDRVPTRQNGGISADGRSYTFRLRPNLRWSDGRPLTARDIDFSWRLWTNPQLAASAASTLRETSP